MKGFVQDIEALAIKNSVFRQVLYTAKHCQPVVMSLKPKEEIGQGSTSATSSFAGRKVVVKHHNRADAEADNEHFDGKTTE